MAVPATVQFGFMDMLLFENSAGDDILGGKQCRREMDPSFFLLTRRRMPLKDTWMIIPRPS